MSDIVHEKIDGLDRERLLGALVPVLRAHGVVGVELIWRTDRSGRVLELSIERPDMSEPGGGVTLDLCSEVSRDLSTALDVADVIPGRYSLQVGSPGLERQLYRTEDYVRFAGRAARVKLKEPILGQWVLYGLLKGLDGNGNVLVEGEQGELGLKFESIEQARLVFEWSPSSGARSGKRTGPQRPRAGHAG